MDYQKTLNLPQTDFSMKAGLTQKEPKQLAEWEEEGLYSKIREAAAMKDKKFFLHDGPPYANGNIHMGHALNKILKDLIVKTKTMAGYDSRYIPGWDCHGLPIEHQLFKEMKKDKYDVDCVVFRKEAHKYAMKYVAIQRDQFKRLGIFGDWDNPYLTLNKDYEYWILRSLLRLQQRGYIYRGLKPVNWCSKCETALAEAEVEYENHTSPSVFVKFHVNNPDAAGIPKNKKISLLIWTTTPWTLMANVAVAVHPQFTYVLAEINDEVIILEKSLSAAVLEKAGIKDYKILKTLQGEELTALRYQHPFGMLSEGCVVTADYVTKEDGTGLVHTAPGHGQDDYQTGLRYKLPILMPVDDRGCYKQEAKEYAGLHVFKANEKIIEDLKGKGVLLASENISHSYPHCWRCKKPIIFRATQQWFLKIDHIDVDVPAKEKGKTLRDRLLSKIKDVKWFPAKGQERITAMIKLRPDWCLSRQRYWGVPIPALECEGCDGAHYLFPEVTEHFAEIVKTKGSDAWFELDIKDLMPKDFKCPHCGKSKFKKTQDILDVWFDSGVSHQAVMRGMLGEDEPVAQMYLEGSDQHRGWFQSSIIPSVAMEGRPPFESVLTHGFVVDADGRKMSKSLGNVISPLDIMQNNGADILRLWTASSDYSEDIRISGETITRLGDSYRKIRNTFRYLLGNLHGFNPDENMLDYGSLLEIDKWALFRLSITANGVKDDYNIDGKNDHYDFAGAFRRIYDFCNEDLSSCYLDVLKDRLYTSAPASQARRSAQTALYHITNHLIRLVAPILVFTAEEIFELMPKARSLAAIPSVHLLEFLDVPTIWKNKDIDDYFELIYTLRPHVLKALEDKRRDGLIGSSLEAKVIFRTSNYGKYASLKSNMAILPEMFIVSQVEIGKTDAVSHPEHNDIEIIIEKADGAKCPRCWNYRTDIGVDSSHPLLCKRCADNINLV